MAARLESRLPGHTTLRLKNSHFRPCSPTYHISIVILLLFVFIPISLPSVDDIESNAKEIRNWAFRFGTKIIEGSVQAVCIKKIEENFNRIKNTVESLQLDKMFEEMRTDVQNMLSWKMEAVEKSAEIAERKALGFDADKLVKFDYFNAKKLFDPRDGKADKDGDDKADKDGDGKDEEESAVGEIELDMEETFDWPVNVSYSAVHVPTNVYDKSNDIVEGIKWSDSITGVFKHNMEVDPFLSWQYFGSSTGFLRIYPAMKWRNGEKTDMYDCRMRRWFVQAAASPKDVVILLDGSGSMLGLRKEIARSVVLTILDTLTENDYFTVIRFSNEIKYIVECTEDTLVRATDENVREFKEHLKNPETANIANFSLALITAFELLQKYNRSNLGSQCNQAIMLITDGAPYTYEEIFHRYNYPNIPVRVFTYLIGREVTDEREVNIMACSNRGYYTHVTTLAEVREQVQKYIPVMSRPIVLHGTRTTIWTSVYADISEVKLTDWIWEEREREKIRKLYTREREKDQKAVDFEESQIEEVTSNENATDFDILSSGPRAVPPTEAEAARKTPKKKIVHLMTTVATPVFNKKNCSMRVADLLGVIGTDVPIKEIIKFASPFKLGVNGYSFVITNNGHILYHPDLRPLFQDLLKPYYSSVDLFEVELVDEEDASDGNQTLKLEQMRRGMIDRKIGYTELVVKIHFDNMRRVVTRRHRYYYGPLDKTPFILVIAIPIPYGRYYLKGQVEVKRQEEEWSKYFHGNNWRVHPDWVYCEIKPAWGEAPVSPEDMIRNFLGSNKSGKIRWKTTGTKPPIYDTLLCEKDLLQSLVFDAKATDVFTNSTLNPNLPNNEHKVAKLFGIVTTFVATRSGLTRFEDYRTEEEKDNSTEKAFYEVHTKATDELFYKRAVDFHYINNTSFVFSVPYDAGTRNNSLVTASHAIFVGRSKKVPVAVVGLQFRHLSFVEKFFNITSQCRMPSCAFKCSDESLDCYLLDNNGFVVVSEIHEHTGKFFGEIDYTVFESLVSADVYSRVQVYDYQAICVDFQATSGPCGYLQTPFNHLKNAISWFWGKIIMYLLQYNIYSLLVGDWVSATDYYYNNDYEYEDDRLLLNRTKAEPCVKVVDLYEMKKVLPDLLKQRVSRCPSSECDKQYFAQSVVQTNLILLAVFNTCPCETTTVTLEPKKVEQSNDTKCYSMKHDKYRKRPEGCINNHPEEQEIKQCGGGSLLSASIYLQFGVHIVSVYLRYYIP